MPTRRSSSSPNARLLVIEQGAKFPFSAAGFRGGSDTAIVVQQHGESLASLRGRLRRAAKELQQAGVTLDTVALIVAPDETRTNRRNIVLMLAELLDPRRTLLLIAERASRVLQHQLISLVGTLMEEDHVEQAIAIDIDASRLAELRRVGAPLLQGSPAMPVREHQLVAC